MKQRLIISLLVASTLLIYSFGYLPFQESGMAGIFAWSWLAFSFLVIGGNIYGLLSQFSRPVQLKKSQAVSRGKQVKVRG
ncbi:hypothetical protein BTR22_02500 [Alkalihalophilus pseudofirmus]|uniref:hypothetical protein n=1 Tax=Alkalihalophilus pseudofirmus TaxID=79885 RepID=UPI000951E846|nr:hypothetical protein [Alkalihalophilus pseudofirmus]OLS39756.1 hypothetical protein BTR22_02500 [Alkalihalophilus pseudofirmus]WEG16219.1 hypothetical protein PQ478_17175 [Alkalihalophilus pseudofirmus]